MEPSRFTREPEEEAQIVIPPYPPLIRGKKHRWVQQMGSHRKRRPRRRFAGASLGRPFDPEVRERLREEARQAEPIRTVLKERLSFSLD